MNRAVEVALAGAVTSVSVLAIAAVASAGSRILRSASQGFAEDDSCQVTGAARASRLRTTLDAAQRRLLTFGTGLFAAVAQAARNFTLSRHTVEVSQREQVADRYAQAVDQLSSGKLDVRIDGVHALERLAHDSPQDHPAVMEVLTGFVREYPRAQSAMTEEMQPRRHAKRMVPEDVQTAITVIGRRRSGRDHHPVNLDHADLVGADLTRADLAYADLTGADLTAADLADTDLRGANFIGASLTGAHLTRARLTGAILRGADLTRANLAHANLAGEDLLGSAGHSEIFGADLTYASLTDADLRGADLSGAILAGADLTGADLTGAILRRADLSRVNLTRANLTREPGAGLFRANLPGANLTGANLTGADLTSADLFGVNLSGAGLFDADLTSADLTSADLSGADLRGACWPSDVVTPVGWERNADSGRLRRAGTDPGEAFD